MIDEKYLELIQADVDGELPEQHRAELSRHLLANPEARAAREELKRLCGLLDSVPKVEPPSDLKASILGAVRLPAPRGGFSSVRGFGVPSGMLRYAAVFAGGLLVSAIAFQVGPDRQSGPRRISGRRHDGEPGSRGQVGPGGHHKGVAGAGQREGESLPVAVHAGRRVRP